MVPFLGLNSTSTTPKCRISLSCIDFTSTAALTLILQLPDSQYRLVTADEQLKPRTLAISSRLCYNLPRAARSVGSVVHQCTRLVVPIRSQQPLAHAHCPQPDQMEASSEPQQLRIPTIDPSDQEQHDVSSPDIANRSDPDDDENLASSTLSSSSITAPPYWLHAANNLPRRRGISSVSSESIPAGAITLRDNEVESQNDRNSACWARSVEILDHTAVNGSATNIGAFVVWNVRVETLNVRSFH